MLTSAQATIMLIEKLIELSNMIHKKTLEQDNYIIIEITKTKYEPKEGF